MELIKEPHDHDVVSGRGNGSNLHPGNIYFRSVVVTNKSKYVASCSKDKKNLKLAIVHQIQNRTPPGRFLDKNRITGLWKCMSQKEALKKTGQALREDAPRLRSSVSQFMNPFTTSQTETTTSRNETTTSGNETTTSRNETMTKKKRWVETKSSSIMSMVGIDYLALDGFAESLSLTIMNSLLVLSFQTQSQLSQDFNSSLELSEVINNCESKFLDFLMESKTSVNISGNTSMSPMASSNL